VSTKRQFALEARASLGALSEQERLYAELSDPLQSGQRDILDGIAEASDFTFSLSGVCFRSHDAKEVMSGDQPAPDQRTIGTGHKAPSRP
jgi:hypothetical protein